MEGRPVLQHHGKYSTDYRSGVATVRSHSLCTATLGQLMESCLVYLDDVILVSYTF
jgi:hypothetical protein